MITGDGAGIARVDTGQKLFTSHGGVSKRQRFFIRLNARRRVAPLVGGLLLAGIAEEILQQRSDDENKNDPDGDGHESFTFRLRE
jgi:hypothetical protein